MSPVQRQSINSLFREVWRIERQIRSERSPFSRVGHDGWPRQELIRFRTSQHLGFAGQDVVEAKVRRTPSGLLASELSVDCLGLTGARGALPPHYTEMVLAQIKSKAPALRDFLDLFNHRLLSLFYRSWEKTQPAVHQERREEGPVQPHFKSAYQYWFQLGGILRCSSGERCALGNHHPVCAYGPDRCFGSMCLPCKGAGSVLADEDQTRLPSQHLQKGQYAHLGEAILGSRAWIADKGAEIVFYPKDRQQLKSLLPDGKIQ